MSVFNRIKTFTSQSSFLTKGQTGLTLASLAILVSACSTASETFDCEPGKGVGCQSITKVNKMIDQERFHESQEGFSGPLSVGPSLKATTPPSFPAAPFPNPSPPTVVLSDNTTVQRIAEQPIRVWVAPYQDGAGNFHEASVVHSVIQGGYWQIQDSGV